MRFFSPSAYRRPRCAVRVCRSPDNPASAFTTPLRFFAAPPLAPSPFDQGSWPAHTAACAAPTGHSPPASSRRCSRLMQAHSARPCPSSAGQRSWGSCPSQCCSGPQVRTAFPPSAPHLPFPGYPPRCFLFEGPAARVLKRFAVDHGHSIAAPGYFPAGQPCLIQAVTALGFASSRFSDAFTGVAARVRPRALPPAAGDRFRLLSAHEL